MGNNVKQSVIFLLCFVYVFVPSFYKGLPALEQIGHPKGVLSVRRNLEILRLSY